MKTKLDILDIADDQCGQWENCPTLLRIPFTHSTQGTYIGKALTMSLQQCPLPVTHIPTSSTISLVPLRTPDAEMGHLTNGLPELWDLIGTK